MLDFHCFCGNLYELNGIPRSGHLNLGETKVETATVETPVTEAPSAVAEAPTATRKPRRKSKAKATVAKRVAKSRGRGRPIVKGSALQNAYKIYNRLVRYGKERKVIVAAFVKAGIANPIAQVYFHLAKKRAEDNAAKAALTPAPASEG
jgi:hypothetical protein